jgi:hypothetical protein
MLDESKPGWMLLIQKDLLSAFSETVQKNNSLQLTELPIGLAIGGTRFAFLNLRVLRVPINHCMRNPP